MNITDFKGPILVTIAYCMVYYGFLSNILLTKVSLFKKYKKNGEKFDRYFGQDRNMLAADRIQLNMLEQMPIFLTLLWLEACFVSPDKATIFGGIYAAARALYPFLMGNRLGREFPLKLLISTVTGYGIITFFMVDLLIKVLE